MTSPIVPMPARGDRSAPRFDLRQPRELRRYFADLDFHFRRSHTTDDQERKRHTCYYVDFETAELWESLAEFGDHAKSFANFVQAIYKLYPGSEEERRWLVADLDKIVEERSRIGVCSLGDLGEYYRQFIAIATFLRNKGRVSEAEQSRAFARGFQCELWARISHRLQLKFPDHFPDDPHSTDNICEAARFVLHNRSPFQLASQITSSPVIASAPIALETKVDNLANLVNRLSEALTSFPSLLHSEKDRSPHTNAELASCNFCGCLEHFIRHCPDATEYIQLRKCQRNSEGKIALPSGSFVPRIILGEF